MARFVTPLKRPQRGEREFAEYLKRLPEKYLCWHDVPLGQRGQRPDFTVLHPELGILLLEVKDWRLDTLLGIDRHSATITTPAGPKRVDNPLEQVRQYCYTLSNLLGGDPLLTWQDGEQRGRLRLPWGHGVVLTSISRAEFAQKNLGAVLNATQVICKDELDSTLEQRLKALFTVKFPCALDDMQIDRVRWHLFPELRLDTTADLFAPPLTPTPLPAPTADIQPVGSTRDATNDLLRIMDLQQEQLARNLGTGHRVIHGVAGSGKTMILAYRARQLAYELEQPVLVLCYNKALAARLGQQLATTTGERPVQVLTFHAWCGELLRRQGLPVPRYRPGDQDYTDKLMARIHEATADGRIPAGQYGAILIDEGHDFQPEWFQLAVHQVSPQSESLLVLYDDAQSLYKRRRFSFSSVGIQARGRTTILRLNYRNTAEVLDAAARFASEWLIEQNAEEDGIPRVPPQSVGRHGPQPLWFDCTDEAAELARVIAYLRERRAELASWSQLAVLGKTNRDNERIHQALQQAGIPASLLALSKPAGALSEDSVKVLTLHASKGLEFDAVAIPFVGQMPHPKAESVEDESRVLYVGMTRSTRHLLLTTSRDSLFSQRLRPILSP